MYSYTMSEFPFSSSEHDRGAQNELSRATRLLVDIVNEYITAQGKQNPSHEGQETVSLPLDQASPTPAQATAVTLRRDIPLEPTETRDDYVWAVSFEKGIPLPQGDYVAPDTETLIIFAEDIDEQGYPINAKGTYHSSTSDRRGVTFNIEEADEAGTAIVNAFYSTLHQLQ